MLTMDSVVLSNIAASVRAGNKGNQWPERIPVDDHAKLDTWLKVMMGKLILLALHIAALHSLR